VGDVLRADRLFVDAAFEERAQRRVPVGLQGPSSRTRNRSMSLLAGPSIGDYHRPRPGKVGCAARTGRDGLPSASRSG
jgi:hypothetical protein